MELIHFVVLTCFAIFFILFTAGLSVGAILVIKELDKWLG